MKKKRIITVAIAVFFTIGLTGCALFDSEVYVVITEGRYHQVKRMFKAVGCEVTYLERKSMGGLELDDTLRRGEYRKLTAEEINTLLNTLIWVWILIFWVLLLLTSYKKIVKIMR